MRARQAGAVAALSRALLSGSVLVGALLLPAGAAVADSPSPSPSPSPSASPSPSPTGSSSDAGTLPGLAQTNSGTQQNGCQTGSGASSTRIPWAQTFLRADEVWSLTQGSGVTVAVVGSGVDDTAGVLAGRLTLGQRAYGTTTSGQDCVGHGTFVAGLIAAQRRPGVGFAGIAPQAQVLAVGVTDQTGITNADTLAAGIRTAADGGARVIDIAMPAQVGSPALSGAVQYAQGKGALVVAPAALDSGGGGNQAAAYPAAYPGVLSVSDLGPSGTAPQGSSSALGQSGQSGVRVDLMAPGDSVMSTGPAGTGYFTASGPSFAAAFVSGSAALTLGYRPNLTAIQLAHRLEATAYHPGTMLPDPGSATARWTRSRR